VIVCGALQRLLALRDECRHVTTMLVAHLRRLTLEIGTRAAAAGLLARREDAFFVTWDELPRVLAEPGRDWRGLALLRRRERERHARLEGPDLLAGDTALEPAAASSGEDLVGLGVSPGRVTGTVRVLRSIEGVERLAGEIVVFPTIEPTLTPVFPLVGGLIAEMGGLLSHAAILAREYGLPAVVNVRDATRRLRDGDRVEIDGTTGRVRVLERRPPPAPLASAGPSLDGGPAMPQAGVAEQRPGHEQPDQRAGQDVRDVVPREVHAAERDRGRDEIDGARQARVERGEHGGDGEDRGGVARGEGVQIGGEGGARDDDPVGRAVRSGPAHQVLDGVLDEPGAREAQRPQPGGVAEP
jgi:phosphohistidine swiveling domain-containing protein